MARRLASMSVRSRVSRLRRPGGLCDPTARLFSHSSRVLAVTFAAPAHAQYFGRNAVQWDRLKFEVLKTDHFDVYYYPEEQLAAEQVATHGRALVRPPEHPAPPPDEGSPARHPLREQRALPADQHHRRRPRRRHRRRHRGLQAPHRPARRRVAGGDGSRARARARARVPVRHDGPGPDLGHELPGRAAHAALVHRGHGRVPLASGPVDPHTAMWLRDAARREKGLPTIRQLDNSAKFFPYRYGQALWAYIAVPLRRRRLRRARCAASGPTRTTPKTVLKGVLHVRPGRAVEGVARGHPRRLRGDGHGQEGRGCLRRGPGHGEGAGRSRSTSGPCSARTAAAWPSSPSATSSRSSCSCRTRRRATSPSGSRAPWSTRTWRASSSSPPRAPSTAPDGASRWGRW